MRWSQIRVSGLGLLFLGLVLAGSRAASADTIIPIAQERFVSTFVNASQCGGEFLEDTDSAGDFGLFEGFVLTEHRCESGTGAAMAVQGSTIGSSALSARGNTLSRALGPDHGVVHAFGMSVFDVTFELESASAYDLSGILTAGATDDTIILFAGSASRLTGPGGVVIFDHRIEQGPGGEFALLRLDETGVLVAGIYTLRATAETVIDNEVPPFRVAETRFDFVLEISATCPADLDGSGAVDFGDILAILSAWGNKGGPEDLDGNGIVDFGDILAVLAAWGPCP